MTRDEHFRLRSCTAKNAYPDRAWAQRVCDTALQERDTELHSYRCTFPRDDCEGVHWHVGHAALEYAAEVAAQKEREHLRAKHQTEKARERWRQKVWKAGYAI